jgi:hypothetical protein
MTIPGFTAEAALRATPGFHPTRRRRGSGGRERVVAQLKGSVFGRRPGGLGTLGDYWPCRDACYTTYDACLMGCEGTVGSPKGSSNCIICDENYRRCLDNCAGDIA